MYSLPTVTFFPDNWQDFVLAMKLSLNNRVDSLVSPSLLAELSCVMNSMFALGHHAHDAQLWGTPTWGRVPG